jgi:transcriptional regulator with XRE-family HTH domain
VDDDVARRFGENVERERKKKKPRLTQERLAEQASIDRTHVSQVEAGKRSVRLETLVKLAGALDVEPAELLDGLRWVPPTTKPGRFVIKQG